MKVKLGINTGFAVNRFPEPADWIAVVSDELGLDTVQFTADLLNPFLPEEVVVRKADTIRDLCARKGVRIETTFTSAFTRVNHVLHPDADIRRVWVGWFKRFIRLSRYLGAEAMGSHFGILSVSNSTDPTRRAERIGQGIAAWREIAAYGAESGLQYVMFEPMSIPRELGETIEATRDLLARCHDGFAIPMRLCLDVDHGDVMSTNPDDTDPHAWLRAFGTVSPCIHIKQSLREKGGHYPFVTEYNVCGRIVPDEILATLRETGVDTCTLLLEISHRERLPMDMRVVADLKESVDYWRPAIERFNAGIP